MLALIFLLVAPAAQASKASSFFKDGQKAEAAGNYDLAVTLYQKAFEADRKNPQYMSALRRTRFVAAMKHLDAGHKLRDQGKLDEALVEFQKSLAMDPSTSIAEQEIGRTQQAIDARKARPAGSTEETLTPQQTRQREFEKKMSTAEAPAELAPTTRTPMNFRATNDSKIIFETIGKNFGINVLTDPDYSGKRITVELVNVTLEQALDYAGILSKTLWAPITPNTIVIYQDSKRRDREPWVLKTIYLSNTIQPTEITEITQVLRNVVDITKIMQVNAQNAIIIRATPDQIAVAEKIINDIDRAKSEVLVDVMVLLVQRDLSSQLGISPVSSGSNGIQLPITFNPGNVATAAATTSATGTTTTPTTSTGSQLTLKQALQAPLNQYSTILPSATINAILSDAHTKILQNPQIRASDGQIAKLRVGERVPIATGTFSTGVVATGGLPAAQTSFQYTDVGVIMEITPRVNAGREVSLKVVVEVSAVDSHVNIGGVDQPVIGQRRIEQDIRLKEGEINVLGGIIEDSESITHSGVPLLGSIPILGHFFSTDQKTISQSEMLVVLTPHIVRSTDYSDLNLRGIDSGTQASIGLRYKQPPPTPEMIAAAKAAAAAAAAAAPVGPPSGALSTAPSGTAAAAAPSSPDAPSGTTLRFSDAAVEVPMGKDFKISLEIVNAQEVNSVPFQLRFDPKVLKLTSVTAGDFLSKDGQSVSLAPTIDPVAGTALVAVTRPPTAPGISGTGKLVTLNFQPLAPGTAKVEVASASARGPVREPKQLPTTLTTITVK